MAKLGKDMDAHVRGIGKGEERKREKGPEPGREHRYRAARDATSINPEAREPIDPRMPHLPPN